MKRDDAASVGFEFGPMTNGGAPDGFDIKADRKSEAEAEDSGARDLDEGV